MENPRDNQQTEFNQTPRQQSVRGDRESYERRSRPSRRGLFTVIALLGMLLVAAVFARGRWLRIKNIEVDGLVRLTKAEVAQIAGITDRTTYFSLDEKKVRHNIENDIRLRFISMEKKWPDGVLLIVEERQKTANVVHMGVQYVISQDGMVLESSRSLSPDNGYLNVTGLDIRDIRYGAPVVCRDEYQLTAMGEIIEELKMQGVLSQTSELILSSLDSIYLVTVDGYTANIGTADRLRAKIGTVRAVVRELREMGKEGGMIEATIPGEASYRSGK